MYTRIHKRTENGSLFPIASFDVSMFNVIFPPVTKFKTKVNVHIFFIFRQTNFIYRIISKQAKYIVEI